MKKLIRTSVILLIMLAFGAFCNAGGFTGQAFGAVTAYASDTYTEGTLYYTVGDGSITITGCFGKDEVVEIPNSIAGIPVNTIAKGAFTDNTYVKQVILPDTITEVEEGAFASDITVTWGTDDEPETTAQQGDEPETEESSSAGDEKETTTSGSGSTEPGESETTTAEKQEIETVSDEEGGIIIIGDSGTAVGAIDEADVYLDDEDEIAADGTETGTETAKSSETKDNGEVSSIAAEDSETKAETTKAASGAESAEETQGSTVSPLPFIIGGIVVVIAAVIVIIIIMKKRKK